MTKMKQAWAITAALAVMIVAVAYMFGVKPQASKVESLDANAAVQAKANTALRGEIARLQEQQAQVPALQMRIKEIRRNLPGHPAFPKLIRDVSRYAAESGVALLSVTPGVPTVFGSAVADEAAAAAAAKAAAAESDDGKKATAAKSQPRPPAATNVGTLNAIQLALNVKGDFHEIQLFISKLEKMERSIAVGTVSVTYSKPLPNDPGPLTVNLGGQIFMVAPPAAAAAPAKAPAAASTEK